MPYARMNVPALMYSTNLHDDYHTPRDRPDRIDYAKLTRMTQWMYLNGWFAANAPKRPRFDAGFKTAALRAWTLQIAQRRGKRIAVVALARRLAGILYEVWRNDVAYDAHRIRPQRPAVSPRAA